MGEIIDLSTLFGTQEPPADDHKVDLSGKPAPKDVRVLLNSGIEVKCEVRYDGLDPDRTRRFLIVAEIDWENYVPKVLIVGETTDDVTLAFRAPGASDEDHQQMAAGLRVVVEKMVRA